jgi:hypothetical protein
MSFSTDEVLCIAQGGEDVEAEHYNQCSICFEEARINLPDWLPCNHTFHENCLRECPICRSVPEIGSTGSAAVAVAVAVAVDVAVDVALDVALDVTVEPARTVLRTLLKSIPCVLMFLFNLVSVNYIMDKDLRRDLVSIVGLVALVVIDCLVLQTSILLPRFRSWFCSFV